MSATVCIHCGRKWFYNANCNDCRSLVRWLFARKKPQKKDDPTLLKWQEGYLAGVTDACNALRVIKGI